MPVIMKIITVIKDFDPKKAYPGVVEQPKTRPVPVYGTQCSCHYGYKCDDEAFDPLKPVSWVEVPVDSLYTHAYDDVRGELRYASKVHIKRIRNKIHS